ncbi:DNA mismatch repair protein mutS [Desulfurobacterium thermolithotrophum DSM 11699]|uniref:DNA mismatch repair protein MutS n=1 Tax=Desulfurobacterium thermolithotrophum (strain DSM 11699 / BSA) TaxID=868864 RepID=F0S470_DESTD|nr:DNA mismatch repair protein MutS [Desulfurobacterium thermolithotrophum]ADY73642.1 DNA mismatch repair protein mutS [Desulfurobacterium thermolithotrophum DSM 11699]
MKKKLTPALKQYLELKEKYKDSILMFRMGDFYEMFFEDAEIAAKELEIALTSRAFGKSSEKAPMCGVPHHAVESYIGKLVRKGYKVAICEQLEEPKPGKKVVDRGVVRVITPGTYFEDENEDRFLLSIYPNKNNFSIAWTELSTGDLYFATVNREDLKSILSKFKPKEIIVPEGFSGYKVIKEVLPETLIQEKEKGYFEVKETNSPEVESKSEKRALSGLLEFIEETQLDFTPKIKPPKRYTGEKYIYLDPQTQKNLELIEPIAGKLESASLFGVLNKTKTGMGRRLLKFWILHPLKDKKEIEERLDAVEELKDSFFVADEILELLSKVYDIERLLSKITSGIASPRDLASFRNSLGVLPDLKKLLADFKSSLLSQIYKNFDDLYDIYCELERVLVENPPFTSREGGLIKEGVNPELDELRRIKNEGEKILKEIEERERKRTGISSLKIGFNNVFGYYIEVSKANLHLVPENYIRRQTLVNAERFITPELKEFEEKILSAQERIEKIEYQLFVELRKFVSKNADRISKTAEKIATIDVLLSFSKIANERGYTKPRVTEGYSIKIKNGKHPVLEKFLEEDFIPNDTELTEKEFILIVTGPNMGGKSVFLRQTALITIMAQIGSFVPAEEAEIGIVDRIFSRVGAADNLSKGLSTFMMEMVETANILQNAGKRSLIILDEIGRGTSTYDGMSIAKAVVEYISGKVGAKTLFATHYHELTELEGKVKGVKNFHVTVEEIDEKIVFTHKVLPGASEKSYGIHVAELAGLPKEVIDRAKEILYQLERGGKELPLLRLAEEKETSWSIGLEEKLIKELEAIEISTTTPLEALMILSRLKEIVKTIKKK